MLLFEEHTSLLLVLHSFFALATVALSTHLVFWLRPFLRGRFENHRSVKRFALLCLGAYAGTMLVGMALYPTYKVRVRAEYLENPSAIHRFAEVAETARTMAAERNKESQRYRSSSAGEVGEAGEAGEAGEVPRMKVERGEKLARWFDVKEHWAALGLFLALANAGILISWQPSAETRLLSKTVFGLALGAAATSWAAAVIGILTSAARSVAGP